MTFGAAPLNAPCAGPATITYVSGEPSTSVALSVIAFAVSSSVVTAWSPATGASFTAVTVSVTVAVFESRLPSFALNVKLSGPL